MAPAVQKIIGKPVPAAEECERDTEADQAAVSLADEQAGNNTEKIRPDGGISGIYRMTLCKTEKISGCHYYSARRHIPGSSGRLGCGHRPYMLYVSSISL